jgi:hypothetical protein
LTIDLILHRMKNYEYLQHVLLKIFSYKQNRNCLTVKKKSGLGPQMWPDYKTGCPIDLGRNATLSL